MSTILTAEELAAIRERESAATEGPWLKCGGYTPHYTAICTGDRKRYIITSMAEEEASDDIVHCDQQQDNARFIAHARQDIPRLLASHAALEQQLAERDKVIADLERQGREND